MAYEATPARAARNRGCARLRGVSRRPARARLDPRRGAPRGDLRRPFLRSCERRAGAGERSEVRRSDAHARAGRAAARAARPLGLRLVPADRRLGLRRQRPPGRLLPAVPAAGARPCHPVRGLGGCAARGGVRRIARRVSRGACAPLPADRARAGAEARAPNAAPARGVPSGRVLRRALFGEPLPAAGGGRLLRGAHRQLGLGGGVRRARVGHAQRRPAAPDPAGDALVELAPAAAARRRLARCSAPLGIAAYAAWLGLVEGDALRFLDVQEAWSRELEGAAGRRLGRLRGRGGRRASARRRARARPCTSRWPPATRSGSRPST